MPAARRPFWSVTAREARAHALILCLVLWAAAAALLLRPGARDPFGHLKGADFVHFYTLGQLVVRGRPEILFDGPRLHELQTELVPASAADVFLPVYPPQTALFFAPLAWLPYGWAAIGWALVTALVYAIVVGAASRPLRSAGVSDALVAFAAAGAPPFWYLMLHGQSTTIPLLGFALAGLAYARGQPVFCGAALALVAVKPQLGLVVAVVLVACREWRVVAGVAMGGAIVAGVTTSWAGSGVFLDYARVVATLPDVVALVEPRPAQMHSLRGVAPFLPPLGQNLIWAGVSAWVIGRAVAVWRSNAGALPRMGAVVVASLLVSPHLTVYDLTLAVPAVLWLGGTVERDWEVRHRRVFWALVYAAVPLSLAPTALWLGVQISVLVWLWLFAISARRLAPRARSG